MTCEKCANKNSEWASYCTQCGVPLGQICDCSFLNDQNNHFCGGCGIILKYKNSKKVRSSYSNDSFTQQYKSKQISNLIKESIYFKAGDEEKLDQPDIDNIFLSKEDSNE